VPAPSSFRVGASWLTARSTRFARRADGSGTSSRFRRRRGRLPIGRGRGEPPKKSEVEAALGAVGGVKKLGELPTDERAHAFELVSDREVDLRPDVFRLAADKGWVLLELHRDAQTLEDVFRSLTIGEERRNRHVGPESDAGDDDQDGAGDDDGDESPRGGSRDRHEKTASDRS
jgi:ABC-2 type transport system ATP-binding protein